MLCDLFNLSLYSRTYRLVDLDLLRCVGHLEDNFSQTLNAWAFLCRFSLRHLILNSFGPCLSSLLDGMYWRVPLILHWLGFTIQNDDIHIDEIVSILSVPPNLLSIEDGITITSSVRFIPYEITTHGQCIVVVSMQIGVFFDQVFASYKISSSALFPELIR